MAINEAVSQRVLLGKLILTNAKKSTAKPIKPMADASFCWVFIVFGGSPASDIFRWTVLIDYAFTDWLKNFD